MTVALYTTLGISAFGIGTLIHAASIRIPAKLEADYLGDYQELNPELKLPTPESVPSSFKLVKVRIQSIAKLQSYPVTESALTVLTTLLVHSFGLNASTACLWVFVATLLLLATIDAKTMFLPDQLTMPLLWFGIALAWVNGSAISLHDAVGGAILGYGLLWGAYWIFRFVMKKEGLGYGDFKLLAAMGAWLGATAVIDIMLFATIAAASLSLINLCKRSVKLTTEIPFGPYLCLGAVVSLLTELSMQELLFASL
ncbi:prepilin peptidase [Photobacterium lutimaris]|nr:A24 family peptidase [Photobacterium lutimaris]TDR72580.1 type IV leader peptidase family protein [Photobacterium lutimaris]